MVALIIFRLVRFRTGKDGTFGELQDSFGNHLFFTVERPWLDNAPNVSCVPPGWYDTEWHDSPSHGKDTLQLLNVLDDREYCQFHSANWAYQLRGCIALGESIAPILSREKGKKIMGVSASRNSIKALKAQFKGQKVRVIVENRF